MSSKQSIKKEDNIESSDVAKEKKDNNVLILTIVVVILSIFIFVMFFINGSFCEDSKCRSVMPIEKELKYQYINYNGYRFKMSLDWKFIGKGNTYEISNRKETMYMTLNTIDMSYDSFISSSFQKEYLEKLQTENSITINKASGYENNDMRYYILDGIYNSYNYYVVVIGDSESVTVISAQFIDKLTYTNMKQSVIDFATSAVKNNKDI